MRENFPNLVMEIDMQVQEAQRVLDKMDAKRCTPRHIILKVPNVKDTKTLKRSKRKEVSYQMVARWEWEWKEEDG